MSEISEMVLEGDLCEICCVDMGDAGEGFPRRCPDCENEDDDISLYVD